MNNFINNLLHPLAVNARPHTIRPMAITGILFLTAGFGLFFIKFSQRIKVKSAAFIIKYLGILATVFGFLTVLPSFHDVTVTLSSALTLLVFFHITAMVLKSKNNS